jgi:hypothetical protein
MSAVRFNSGLACWLALSAALQAQQYVFRAYRQAEGLKNLAVNALTTDRSGFLWVATENGVYRFLGSSFEQYGKEQGIAERDVEDIYADPTGIVWAGTDENLYRWDGQRFLAAGKNPIQIPWRAAFGRRRCAPPAGGGQGPALPPGARCRGKDALLRPGFFWRDARIHTGPEPTFQRERCGRPDRLDGLRQEAMFLRWEIQSAVTQWGTDKGVPESIWHAVVLDHEGGLWVAGQQHHVVLLPRGNALCRSQFSRTRSEQRLPA